MANETAAIHSLEVEPAILTAAGAPKASISLNASSLSAATVSGLNALPQTFEVWSSRGESLSYSVSADQAWLKCFPASGTSTGEHDSITVSFATGTLSIGTHPAKITISDPAADNSPRTISVSLTVTDFPGAIVDLNFEDKADTVAKDSSGYNNNGILHGGVGYTMDHAVGSYGLSFDGVDDYVSCPGNGSLRPDYFSVALWIKHVKDTGASPANYGGILQGAYGNGYDSGFRILDYWNQPCVQISFGDVEPIGVLGPTLPLNEWTHVAVTYDHKRIRIYQNGQLVVERPETRSIKWAAAPGELSIGRAQWYFNGLIDKVMMFGTPLTAQQVQQLQVNFRPAELGGNLRPVRPRLPMPSLRRSDRERPGLAEPRISLSPAALSVSAGEGRNAFPQTFLVRDAGRSTLRYSITSDQGWLTCFPESGTCLGEHDAITVSYATASLPRGKHTATITISDPEADNSPQIIPVNLTVTGFPQVMQLNFDEGGGATASDSSGNTRNGTLEGGAVYTTDRATGSHALIFDGVDDCVVCRPDMSFRPDNISIALWVKHVQETGPTWENSGGIIQGAYGNGYYNGFRILDSWDRPIAQINFGDAEPLTLIGHPFAPNEWSHIVLTYDQAMVRLYQNGELAAERPETRNINWQHNASDLRIGLAQWYFSGLIDTVIFSGSALSAQQVRVLYGDR